MPVLVDPEQIFPEKQKPRPTASQIIAWLLYPVVLLVGVAVGIAIGVKEAPRLTNEQNANKSYSNAKIVQNINTTKNTNKNSNSNSNSTTNTNGSLLNSNIFHAGDSARIDAATEAQLLANKQADLNRLVDKTVDFIDILRQQDLIELQYALKAYFTVRGDYPSTDGKQIRLERNVADTFYTAMKDFYGGTFYEKIDPQSPQYYYGYTSDGQTYTLSAYLTSRKKAFYLTSDQSQ